MAYLSGARGFSREGGAGVANRGGIITRPGSGECGVTNDSVGAAALPFSFWFVTNT